MSAYKPNSSQRSSLQIPSHHGVKASVHEFWGDTFSLWHPHSEERARAGTAKGSFCLSLIVVLILSIESITTIKL